MINLKIANTRVTEKSRGCFALGLFVGSPGAVLARTISSISRRRSILRVESVLLDANQFGGLGDCGFTVALMNFVLENGACEHGTLRQSGSVVRSECGRRIAVATTDWVFPGSGDSLVRDSAAPPRVLRM